MDKNPQQLIDQQRSFLIKQFNHAFRAPSLTVEEKQQFLGEFRALILKLEETTSLCK